MWYHWSLIQMIFLSCSSLKKRIVQKQFTLLSNFASSEARNCSSSNETAPSLQSSIWWQWWEWRRICIYQQWVPLHCLEWVQNSWNCALMIIVNYQRQFCVFLENVHEYVMLKEKKYISLTFVTLLFSAFLFDTSIIL